MSAVQPSPGSSAGERQWWAALAEGATEADLAGGFRRGRSHHTLESLEAALDEVLRLAYVDAAKAVRVSRAAGWLAERLGTPYARSIALRCAGHVAFVQARYADALAAYREAIALLEPLGRDLDAGRTRMSGLQALVYLGQYDEAWEWASRAREIFRRHGDRLRLARLDSNAGNILYRQDRHAEALAMYARAYDGLRQWGEPKDAAAALSNMAVCSITLGRFRDAMVHYRAARRLSLAGGLPLLVAAADYNIAYLHFLRGEYVRALRLYQTTRSQCEKSGDAYHAALCDLDESEIHLELNRSSEGSRLAARAAAGFERLRMNYERAKAMVNHAVAVSRYGETRRACRLLGEARRLFAAERNAVWPALVDLYHAHLLMRENRDRAAARLCRAAQRQLALSAMPGKAASCELLEAQLALRAGRPGRALEICLRLLERDPDSAGPALRFQARFLLGQAEERLGRLPAALERFREAGAELESLRSRLRSDDLKISILRDKIAVYESLFCLDLGQTPRAAAHRSAFLDIQRAKSRGLAEQIALPLLSPVSVGKRRAARIERLRGDLNWHYRQVESAALEPGEGAAAAVAAWCRRTAHCEEALLHALAGVRAPRTRGGPSDVSQPLPLEEIRGRIPDDAALVEYYEARGVLHAAVVTGLGLRVVPLGLSAGIRQLLRLHEFQISKFRLGDAFVRRFEKPLLRAAHAHLRELYSLLLAPLARFLDRPGLIICPHGPLHSLPFHTLFDGSRFAMDRWAISYAPSASIYALCAARHAQKAAARSLVLGVPDERTPHLAGEARAAAALLPRSRLYLGKQATLRRFRELAPGSRFIHIATHGLYRHDNPVFSSVRLGDAYLSLLDLYQIPLSAELVALSGCGTGRSGVVGADELLGLSRGLLLSGARAMLVSLWDTHDESSARLITAFYRHLSEGSDKAEALRQAMREVRGQYQHPYYWGPFVLAGKV